MIKFQNLLTEQDQDLKEKLKRGLKRVASVSHLVTSQINNNLNKFIENLDTEDFKAEFGDIKDVLGVGVFGAVFDLEGGKVLKITFDYHEAPFLFDLSKNARDGMVNVDKVVAFPFGDSKAYGIVRDGLTPIDESSYRRDANQVMRDLKRGRFDKSYKDKIKRNIKNALMSMYQMDSNWKGTHVGNLGIQNGNVVLYDGFSKNVDENESKIPVKSFQI